MPYSTICMAEETKQLDLSGKVYKLVVAIIILIGVIGLGALFYLRPYLVDRVLTFLDPSRDPLNSSYQVNQSLIAVGAGQFLGRGFGAGIRPLLLISHKCIRLIVKAANVSSSFNR